jgi:hypothetical protein
MVSSEGELVMKLSGRLCDKGIIPFRDPLSKQDGVQRHEPLREK